jgi:hypothetical protein
MLRSHKASATAWYSVSVERLLSGRHGDPVGPSADNRFTVEIVEIGHDAPLEFGF